MDKREILFVRKCRMDFIIEEEIGISARKIVVLNKGKALSLKSASPLFFLITLHI